MAAIIAAERNQSENIGRAIVQEVEETITDNMFKYNGFSNVKRYLIDTVLKKTLEVAKIKYNISKTSISKCKKKNCDAIREECEILLLTPLYIFMDTKRVTDTGARHLNCFSQKKPLF